jgi:multisubunit Na+/H+ antiporter MnhB subunit
MTTTTASPQATVERRDLRRFWRLLIAIALPIGPLGVTIMRGFLPYWTSDDSQVITEKIAAHQDVMNALSWVMLICFPPLLLGMLVLGYVARRGAPVLATLGAGLSFVAYANSGAAGNSDYTALTMFRDGFDVATVHRVVEASYAHPISTVSGMFWVIGHIVGMILLGIALYRSRVVPRWVGVALAVSQPIHLISAIIVPSRLLDVTLGWGLTTLGFLMVSIAIARTPDDAWDLPPVRS